jgi:hypothetical protein
LSAAASGFKLFVPSKPDNNMCLLNAPWKPSVLSGNAHIAGITTATYEIQLSARCGNAHRGVRVSGNTYMPPVISNNPGIMGLTTAIAGEHHIALLHAAVLKALNQHSFVLHSSVVTFKPSNLSQQAYCIDADICVLASTEAAEQ